MDIGWSELLVIGVVALVVIGPKDLPEMFRTLGRFTAKLRSMAREFSRAMEDAAKESGMNDVANDLRKVASPKSMGLDAVKSAADKFEKWDPLKTARGSTPGTTAAAGGAAAGGAVAAAGLGSAAGATAAESTALPDPNAPAAPVTGPNTTDLAMKRAEREAIAREAAERLRNTPPPPQSTASAFEDAPATIITPPVTSTPLDTAPAAKPAVKPAAKPAAKRKAATAQAGAAKPAAKAKPAAAKSDPAKATAKPRASARKAPAKPATETGLDKAEDQA